MKNQIYILAIFLFISSHSHYMSAQKLEYWANTAQFEQLLVYKDTIWAKTKAGVNLIKTDGSWTKHYSLPEGIREIDLLLDEKGRPYLRGHYPHADRTYHLEGAVFQKTKLPKKELFEMSYNHPKQQLMYKSANGRGYEQ